MSSILFWESRLKDAGAWKDYRSIITGGYGWRGDRRLADIRAIVVHHTVTRQYGNADKEVAEILNMHKARGFGGIGYHFLITSEIKNGYAVVAYVGDIGSIRAHDPNMKGKAWSPIKQGNVYSIGISFVGDHTKKMAGTEQLRSAKLLIAELLYDENSRLPSLNGWENVYGHGYSSYTWCCDGNEGKTLIPLIQSVQLDNEAVHPIPVAPEFDFELYKKDNKLFMKVLKGEINEAVTVKNLSKGTSWEVSANKNVNNDGNAVNTDIEDAEYEVIAKSISRKYDNRKVATVIEVPTNPVIPATPTCNCTDSCDCTNLRTQIAIIQDQLNRKITELNIIKEEMKESTKSVIYPTQLEVAVSPAITATAVDLTPPAKTSKLQDVLAGIRKYDSITFIIALAIYAVLSYYSVDETIGTPVSMIIGLLLKTIITTFDTNNDGKLDNSDKPVK